MTLLTSAGATLETSETTQNSSSQKGSNKMRSASRITELLDLNSHPVAVKFQDAATEGMSRIAEKLATIVNANNELDKFHRARMPV